MNKLSYRNMDQIFYQATGEHLPIEKGDAAPLPLEWHIQATLQRQERQRMYEILYTEMRGEGAILLKKEDGMVNNSPYDMAELMQDIAGVPIFLYYAGKKVVELWKDGSLPTPLPSRSGSPHQPPQKKFVLQKPPAWTYPHQRLRKGFRGLLSTMPTSALWVELEEWREELERAKEHLDAVKEELVKRGEREEDQGAPKIDEHNALNFIV
jgi:hypothetical protein